MRRLILLTACLAIAGLVAVSLYINYTFGSAIGGPLIGAISIGFDLLKIAMPTVIVLACTVKGHSLALRTVAALLAVLFWLPFTLWGLQSAGGAALLLRAEYTETRQGAAEKYRDLAAQKERLQAKAPWTPEIVKWKDKPSAALAIQAEAYKANWAWKASAGCEQPSTDPERKYCQIYALMLEAKETAKQAEADADRLAQVESELASTPRIIQADPFAKAAGDLFHVDPQTVVSVWAAVLALLLEFAPNLGPAILMLAFLLLEAKEAKEPAKLHATEAVPCHEPSLAPEPVLPPKIEPSLPEIPAGLPAPNVIVLDDYRKIVQPSEPDPGTKLVLAAVQELGAGRHSLAAIREMAAKLAPGQQVPHFAQIGKILRKHGHKRCGRDMRQGVRSVAYDLAASLPERLTNSVSKTAI